jgi:phosphatidylserine decarboxylase
MQNFIEAVKLASFPIHKEGYKFILIFALATIFLSLLSNSLGLIGLVATLWCIFFFRDPERIITDVKGAIISPADGVVTSIEENIDSPLEVKLKGKKFNKITIFLNVFNVHVNRVPVSGKVEKVIYIPGKFLSANFNEAGEENERNLVHLKTEDKKDIIFTQVAGMVARRIVSDLEDGQDVTIGQKYGIIRFGSRMDIYLPSDIEIVAKKGQTMIGGETIIANQKK